MCVNELAQTFLENKITSKRFTYKSNVVCNKMTGSVK